MRTKYRVLEAIEGLARETGYPPTIREIADMVGRDTSAVLYHMRALREQKLIDFEDGKARTVRVK